MLTLVEHYFFVIVFILIGICLLACLIAAIRGPELGDRIVAANVIGTMTIATIALLSYFFKESWLLDVALIYTMISFLAVVVLTRIFIRRYKSREENERKEG
ncbi:MAG: monovalent cation/H+ antiporter complex subunit F [Clostridiales bacterium]|nr:monovalent cation/H+ antiporter complex subunit F [Eubacterium sp.]MDD7348604.1 monovalent cation/H+ antiporter complex subunit F [Clostridiales bacterium]MDY3773948.1 monovalent cation/H+ antiporter complex subunit F [Eubacterium sp.]